MSLAATDAHQASVRLAHAFGRRLFHDLRKCIRIVPRSGDPVDDYSYSYNTEWVTGYKDDDDPGLIILNAFRENGELWLHAAPAEDVVVLPREVFARIVAALPPLPGAFEGIPALTADDWAELGRKHICALADQRRHLRERAEREKERVT